MSTTNTDHDRLQRYFDGELSVEESAAIRKELEADNTANELAKLETLHTAIQSAADTWSTQIDADALFAKIQSGLSQADTATQGAAEVRAQGAQTELEPETAVGHEVSSNGTSNGRSKETEPRPSLKVIRGGGQRRVWGGVAVGIAAAAAVFLAIFSTDPGPSDTVERPQIASAHLGSEVLEVDFGANTGTVFEVRGAVGQPLAVVWIDDEEVGLP